MVFPLLLALPLASVVELPMHSTGFPLGELESRVTQTWRMPSSLSLDNTNQPLPTDLEDAGARMAEDPRFVRCGVEHLYTGLVGTAPPPAARHHLSEGFVAADLRLSALAQDIVLSDAYLQADQKVLTPEQLATSLRDLLGVPVEDPGARVDEGLHMGGMSLARPAPVS